MSTTITTKADIVSRPILVADDERGIIEQLTDQPFYSVLRITSKAGTVRANHYHKKDSHLCYLVKGKIRYVYREAGDESASLEEVIIESGQLFYTPPMIAHAMHFLEDSEFYTFSGLKRDRDSYEDDLIRVTLVSPEDAKNYQG
jgi:dTDP-4-dehydrorhamnose 3,5-epimerase-like enzyme